LGLLRTSGTMQYMELVVVAVTIVPQFHFSFRTKQDIMAKRLNVPLLQRTAWMQVV